MRHLACFAAAAVFLLGSGMARGAEGTTHFVIGPRSTLVLNGSSNFTAWRCTGRTLNGAMDIAAPIEKINNVIDRIEDGDIAQWMSSPAEGRFPEPQLDLTIPIAKIRCDGGPRMEKDMKRALKADRFPDIAFHFAGLRFGITHDIDRRQFEAMIAAELSLAGVTREVSFAVSARRVSRSEFRLIADMPIRMTDFRITPPGALFGIIKAANDLSVRLDLTVEVSP